MGSVHKIIFTGPVGSGKTTAIQSLSDTDIVMTDATASDFAGNRKATTTVAMDFGVMQLNSQERIHLYGTPGQERFDFMWEILTEGGLGLVLLLDNTRGDPFKDMRFFVDAFRPFIDRTTLVIGVTRTDLKETPYLEDYHAAMERTGLRAPIFEVDARSRDDVSLLVQALLYNLDPGLAE